MNCLGGLRDFDELFVNKLSVCGTNYYGDSETVGFIADVGKMKDYIVGLKEFRQYTWDERLEMVEIFIQENGMLPSSISKNSDEKKIGRWVNSHKQNYKRKRKIMKNDYIRMKWEEFIEKHRILFKTFEEIWYDLLSVLNLFIFENKKLPSVNSKFCDERKLGDWLVTQKQKYKLKTQNMKNEDIRKKWEEFVEKHQLIRTNEEKWYDSLDKFNSFISEKKKIPSRNSKNYDEAILSTWLDTQKQNYKSKIHIMSDMCIRTKWEEFIETHWFLLRTNEEMWYDLLDKLNSFISESKKLPSAISKKKDEKKLILWLYTQKYSYKSKTQNMKNEDIRTKWEEFVEKHRLLLITNEEKWYDSLDKVILFISENNKLPSQNLKDLYEKKLSRWLSRQKESYDSKKNGMINEDIRAKWKEFTETHKDYIKTR
jgi:hypothetical protein